MKKRAREDPLVTKIQHELMLGHFVRHDDVSELINGMDRVHDQVEALAKSGEAARAVRLYEILLSGRSKYYDAALDHLEKAHDLYCGAGQASEWEALVRSVRTVHSRKSGFLSAFEQLASGKTQRFPSFADQAQEGWKRLTL